MTNRTLKMTNNRSVKYYDTHTLYVTSGVAREKQLYQSLRIAIKDGEERYFNETLEKLWSNMELDPLNFGSMTLVDRNKMLISKLEELGYDIPEKKTWDDCRIKVNLIVNKSGEFFGFGYIFVSSEEVYWMLLGKNPDGTDRVLEYLDPDWNPPKPKSELTAEEESEKYSGMKWYEIAEEEDRYVHPVIKKVLPPLMPVPGYQYDEDQYKHFQEVAREDGKDPESVPDTGFFVLSRAYVKEVEPGKVKHQLCSRQIPKWIPPIAFKQIFGAYITDNDSKTCKIIDPVSNEYVEETYPLVEMIEGKKDNGNIVLVSFSPDSRKAQFTLLMTKKVNITHPSNPDMQSIQVFNHAWEDGKNKGRPVRHHRTNQRYKPHHGNTSNRNERNTRERSMGDTSNRRNRRERETSNSNTRNRRDTRETGERSTGVSRDDVDISKYNYTKK